MISKSHKNFKQKDITKKHQPTPTLNNNFTSNRAFIKHKYKYLLKSFYLFKGKASPVFFTFNKSLMVINFNNKIQTYKRLNKFSTNISFYVQNKNFSSKTFISCLNYSHVILYSFSLSKLMKSFNLSFPIFYNSLTTFNINTTRLYFSFSFYYLFYCNFLPFLSKKTSNYCNNTNSVVPVKPLNTHLFFIKNKTNSFHSLNYKPRTQFNKLSKLNLISHFIFILVNKKNTLMKKSYPTFTTKILKTFSLSLRNFYCKYLFFSKSFFINFSRLSNFESKFFNVFKLSPHDWISDSLAKLTKDSIHLNSNNYLLFKSINSNTNPLIKLITTSNSFNTNDSLFENCLFFPFFKNSPTPISLINNSFFKNNNPTLPYKLSLRTPSTVLIDENLFINLINSSLAKYTNKFETLVSFFFKPLYFKFLTLNDLDICNVSNYVNDYFFYTSSCDSQSTNVTPSNSFAYVFKKKMLKVFNYSKFPTITSIWHYHALIRFLEFCSGKKTYLRFNTFLNNTLNFSEKAQCVIWAQKVKYFRKVLGPRLFLTESLQIIYLALKLKDPYILSNWMVSTMQKISFWKYKTFLRYVKYVLRYFFWIIFKQLGVKGVKFQLKGKISVAGNARTRTVLHTIGFTSHTTYDNKILYRLNLVKTFTGVLGLKLWIVF